MQPVDGVGSDVNRGIKAEGYIGAEDVVVDCLRHSHNVQPQFGKHPGGALRTVTADAYQAIESQFMIGILDLFTVLFVG